MKQDKSLIVAICVVGTFALSGISARADENQIEFMGYNHLPQDEKISFENYFQGDSVDINQILHLPGVSLGEAFFGQVAMPFTYQKGENFELVRGTPSKPLQFGPSNYGSNLFFGFESNGNFYNIGGIGPDGFQAQSGRGEGSIAILFDSNICKFGFRNALEDNSRGGRNSAPGGFPYHSVERISFYDENSVRLAVLPIKLIGMIGLGYQQSEKSQSKIRGVLIENFDVEGVGINDLIIVKDCYPSVS